MREWGGRGVWRSSCMRTCTRTACFLSACHIKVKVLPHFPYPWKRQAVQWDRCFFVSLTRIGSGQYMDVIWGRNSPLSSNCIASSPIRKWCPFFSSLIGIVSCCRQVPCRIFHISFAYRCVLPPLLGCIEDSVKYTGWTLVIFHAICHQCKPATDSLPVFFFWMEGIEMKWDLL